MWYVHAHRPRLLWRRLPKICSAQYNNIVLWEPSLPEHTRGSVACCSRHENTLVLREPHLPERTCGQPHAFAVCILQPGQRTEILGINKLQNTAVRFASQALRACSATHLSVAFVLVPHSTLPSKALFINSSALTQKTWPSKTTLPETDSTMQRRF